MNISVRRFIISMTATLLIFALIAGIAAVTYSGSSITKGKINIKPEQEDVVKTIETADNALSIMAPELKAAAHCFLIVCAALSKLYESILG